MVFATYIEKKGLITSAQVAEALHRQIDTRPLIGTILLEWRLLSIKQMSRLLSMEAMQQQTIEELAVEAGLISEQDLIDALLEQCRRAKPLAEILIEMGALTHEQVAQEMRQLRRTRETTNSTLRPINGYYTDVNQPPLRAAKSSRKTMRLAEGAIEAQ